MSTTAGVVEAFYSLVFPNFTYYLQTLSVSIGRRSLPTATESSSEQDSTPQVDVDLGPLKSVSRLHAKITYDDDDERFVLDIYGRNGAWVDGNWSGAGARVPLDSRSQIQIATRTFYFILPPAPAPEESPTATSPTSTSRPRSPSLDVTSLSPASSAASMPSPTPLDPDPDPDPEPEPEPEPQIVEQAKPKNVRKSKPPPPAKPPPPRALKANAQQPVPVPPAPEVMPPKPSITYANLCYRAIKSHGGRATLAEVTTWMMDNFDWYRLNEGKGWESSVRHNLSSNPAFVKIRRQAQEKGKGCFWGVEKSYVQTFEDNELRSTMASASASAEASGSKVGGGKGGGKEPPGQKAPKVKREKGGASILEPALKRSAKAAAPLLTNKPLPLPMSNPSHASLPPGVNPLPTSLVARPACMLPPAANASSTNPADATPVGVLKQEPTPSVLPAAPPPQAACPGLTEPVLIPIIVGPLPPTYPIPTASSSAAIQALPLEAPPIVLHEGTLILNPRIFAHLPPAHIAELERLGATRALEALQRHLAIFLKGQMQTRGGARGRGRGRALARGAAPRPVASSAAGAPPSGAPPPVAMPTTTTIASLMGDALSPPAAAAPSPGPAAAVPPAIVAPVAPAQACVVPSPRAPALAPAPSLGATAAPHPSPVPLPSIAAPTSSTSALAASTAVLRPLVRARSPAGSAPDGPPVKKQRLDIGVGA